MYCFVGWHYIRLGKKYCCSCDKGVKSISFNTYIYTRTTCGYMSHYVKTLYAVWVSFYFGFFYNYTNEDIWGYKCFYIRVKDDKGTYYMVLAFFFITSIDLKFRIVEPLNRWSQRRYKQESFNKVTPLFRRLSYRELPNS